MERGCGKERAMHGKEESMENAYHGSIYMTISRIISTNS